MIYYRQPLRTYEVDSFVSTVQVNTHMLTLRYQWPIEVQKLYDMQLALLDTTVRSQGYYLSSDPDGIQRIGYTPTLIQQWKLFMMQWEQQQDVIDVVANTFWPISLKQAVIAVLQHFNDSTLYLSIRAIVGAMQPVLDYLQSLDDELLWRVTIRQGSETRELCMSPNVWYFQNESDWRLYFETDQGRITKFNMSEVDMIIALGDGDI